MVTTGVGYSSVRTKENIFVDFYRWGKHARKPGIGL